MATTAPGVQLPLPAVNSFLQRAAGQPTRPRIQPWKVADGEVFARDAIGALLDNKELTNKRVQLYFFTQNGHYMSTGQKVLFHHDNIISPEIDIREGQVDTGHWASDGSDGDRISKAKAMERIEKYRDSLKKVLFAEFVAALRRLENDIGRPALQAAPKAGRIDLFLRAFDQDPLNMAVFSAGPVVSKLINFDALYHNDEYVLDSGDDIASYMRTWIRWKFAETCEIVYQRYVLNGTTVEKRRATEDWVSLWQRWARGHEGGVYLDESLLSPENWPVH